MSLVVLILFLVVAVVSAHLASKVVACSLPGGHTSAVLVGVIGAFLGNAYISSFGPMVENVSVLPAILGSIASVVVMSYLGRLLHKTA